jgi:hypothetical protein
MTWLIQNTRVEVDGVDNYDLIVHFKGFNNIFANRGDLFEKEAVISNVCNEFVAEILSKFDTASNTNTSNTSNTNTSNTNTSNTSNTNTSNTNTSNTPKKILIVWDGDDFGENQWTLLMLDTVKKLTGEIDYTPFEEDRINLKGKYVVDMLTCYNNDDMKKAPGYRDEFGKMPSNVGKYYAYTYGKTDSDSYIGKVYEDVNVDNYNEVGMMMLYLTSNKIKQPDNNNRILVLCAGGGQTPVNELHFTNNEVPQIEEGKDDVYKSTRSIIHSMGRDTFYWYYSLNEESQYRMKDDDKPETSSLIYALAGCNGFKGNSCDYNEKCDIMDAENPTTGELTTQCLPTRSSSTPYRSTGGGGSRRHRSGRKSKKRIAKKTKKKVSKKAKKKVSKKIKKKVSKK